MQRVQRSAVRASTAKRTSAVVVKATAAKAAPSNTDHIAADVTQLVGNTPMVFLNRVTKVRRGRREALVNVCIQSEGGLTDLSSLCRLAFTLYNL